MSTETVESTSTSTPIESEVHAAREAESARLWSIVAYYSAVVADSEAALEDAITALAERKMSRAFSGSEGTARGDRIVTLAKTRVAEARENLYNDRENLANALTIYLVSRASDEGAHTPLDAERVLARYRAEVKGIADEVSARDSRAHVL